jgi:hypothetical protein
MFCEKEEVSSIIEKYMNRDILFIRGVLQFFDKIQNAKTKPKLNLIKKTNQIKKTNLFEFSHNIMHKITLTCCPRGNRYV